MSDQHENDPSSGLANDEVTKLNAYWRACNYLAAGMINLRDNPLLKDPLKPCESRQAPDWCRSRESNPDERWLGGF